MAPDLHIPKVDHQARIDKKNTRGILRWAVVSLDVMLTVESSRGPVFPCTPMLHAAYTSISGGFTLREICKSA